jgi:hypothetical protein
MPSRKARDHLVPAACVESCGVAKEDRRIGAGPFPQRDLNSVHGESMFNGHF